MGIADGAFALGTFEAVGGAAFPALVRDSGDVVDLSASWPSLHDLFDDWAASWPALQRLADRPATHAYDGLRPLPPLHHPDILQAGANFRRHVIELVVAERYDQEPGQSPDELRDWAAALMDRRAAEGEPLVFPGLCSAMCGARDDVVLPAIGVKHDWELELAVVIGTTARNVNEADAMAHVGGYTIANDLTMREHFFRTDTGAINVDFISSKNAPTFLPVGPVILPAAFMGPLDEVRITLSVNGEVRQNETLDDMIFGVPRLVSYASSRAVLRPGDLLLCGSPAGNGSHWQQYLTDGDVIDATITGLGAQRNRCVAER